MGPALPLNSDEPNRNSHEEFRRSSDGGGPPPLIISISSESDDDENAVNDFAEYVESIPSSFDHPTQNDVRYELLSQDPEYYPEIDIPSHADEVSEGVISLSETIETFQRNGVLNAAEENSTHEDKVPEKMDKHGDSVSPKTNDAKEAMDPEHIERIKNVMKSIKLPTCNLPEWSQFVPEEKWKGVLMNKLHITSDSQIDSSTNSRIAISQPSGSNAVIHTSNFSPVTNFSDLQLSKDSSNSPDSQLTDVSSSNSPSVKNSSNAQSTEELFDAFSSNNSSERVHD